MKTKRLNKHKWHKSTINVTTFGQTQNAPVWRCMRCKLVLWKHANEKIGPKEPIYGLTCKERQIKMVLES